jgi:hypothetical protein
MNSFIFFSAIRDKGFPIKIKNTGKHLYLSFSIDGVPFWGVDLKTDSLSIMIETKLDQRNKELLEKWFKNAAERHHLYAISMGETCPEGFPNIAVILYTKEDIARFFATVRSLNRRRSLMRFFNKIRKIFKEAENND